MESAVKSKGQKPSLGVLLAANVRMIGELMEIGKSGGFFQVQEEQVGPILQDTMQRYITKGLKDKSIDPIELQQAVEPMMEESQKQQGLEMANQMGVPQEPGMDAALESYAGKRVDETKSMLSNQNAAKASTNARGQLAASAQGGQQNG